MASGWWGVAGDEGVCWAGWGRGADRGRGWRVMAMMSMPAMRSMHALLACRQGWKEVMLSQWGRRGWMRGGPGMWRKARSSEATGHWREVGSQTEQGPWDQFLARGTPRELCEFVCQGL